MIEIYLHPKGYLRFDFLEPYEDKAKLSMLASSSQRDWREALFLLASDKIDSSSSTARYWRAFAEIYVTALCHKTDFMQEWSMPPPSSAELANLILSAPPMQGGEYISESMLRSIWKNLDLWVQQQISRNKIDIFLQKYAPKWNQVGRVCFHLAENKNNLDKPFAFLATYATGFGASGQVKHLPLERALKEYVGKKNIERLLKLLQPVQKAKELCPWVKELIASKEIYQALPMSISQAYQMLRSIPELEQSGLTVKVPNWWAKRAKPKVSVTIGEVKKSSLGLDAILDLDVKVALGDHTLTQEEIRELMQVNQGLVLFKGQWIEVDHKKLEEAIAHWDNLLGKFDETGISFIEGMRLLSGTSHDLKQDDLIVEESDWVHINAGQAMRELLSGLREPQKLQQIELTQDLCATLRPYQIHGLSWLALISHLGLGACLADDMGLGKTIQVLALLLHHKQNSTSTNHRQPSILVIPASLLGNWKQEATRFTPSLRLSFLHPAETPRKVIQAIEQNPQQELADSDLVVTTYSMLTRQTWLQDLTWHLAILDEAQAIKNPSTRQSKAAKQLKAYTRIALTGTPVENRLGDLWSIFDFINPGLLGSTNRFQNFVTQLQQRQTDTFAPLRKLVSPYILRRMKTDPNIISDLPEKTEVTCFCNLSKQQIQLYQQIVQSTIATISSVSGIERRGIVLQTLLQLKQTCNHPSQVSGDGEYIPDHSGKFSRLAEICEEINSRQEKVLIFTQFREIIAYLQDYLASIFGRNGLVLHGGTNVKIRKQIVAEFQSDYGPPFFILSLKAGGTGLNLTAASHVIHFDRWWNPAVENQATDRTFRIGQKRNVLVHKFVTRGTVEERIDQLIAEKQQLSNQILSPEDEINLTELNDEELLKLISLDITRASF